MTNRQKNSKYFFWWFLVILSLVFVVIFVKIIFSHNILRDRGRTTILFNTIPVLIVSLNHDNNSVQIISFPTTAEINVVEGYGTYRAGKIYNLDTLEKKNGRLFINSFAKGLGIPIEGYVSYSDNILRSDENNMTKEDIARFKQKLFNPVYFVNLFWKSDTMVSTNLSAMDFIRGFIFLTSLRPNKINFINLFNEGAFTRITLPDRTESLATDYQKIDGIIKEILNEQSIISENLKIEVLNSTDYEGLAEDVSRIVSRFGAGVLNTGNDSEKLNRCKIYTTKPLDKTYTVKRLQKYFGCELSVKPRTASRTDISLILGEEIKKEFYYNLR